MYVLQRPSSTAKSTFFWIWIRIAILRRIGRRFVRLGAYRSQTVLWISASTTSATAMGWSAKTLLPAWLWLSILIEDKEAGQFYPAFSVL
jgi:hypothetical protein